jgi:hypothetical protein
MQASTAGALPTVRDGIGAVRRRERLLREPMIPAFCPCFNIEGKS